MEPETGTRAIGRIMTVRIVTIQMDDSVEVVRDIFQKVQFHHLLVVDNEKLVGIISDRDVLKAVSPFIGTISETTRDRATLNKRVHQIMSYHPVTVRASCTLQEAIQLMLARGVSCLPVTTSDGEILGVLTWKDVFRAFLDSKGFTGD